MALSAMIIAILSWLTQVSLNYAQGLILRHFPRVVVLCRLPMHLKRPHFTILFLRTLISSELEVSELTDGSLGQFPLLGSFCQSLWLSS